MIFENFGWNETLKCPCLIDWIRDGGCGGDFQSRLKGWGLLGRFSSYLAINWQVFDIFNTFDLVPVQYFLKFSFAYPTKYDK